MIAQAESIDYYYVSEKENLEIEEKELTVDLSNQSIKKIERATEEQREATSLILDENGIQRLENIDSYMNLKKVRIFPLFFSLLTEQSKLIILLICSCQ